MMGRLVGLARQHAIGFVALSVALGGTSYAVTTKKLVGRDGRVNACVKTKTGTARLVVEGARCRKGEQRVTWSQRGLPALRTSRTPTRAQG
jgi:hypothetical protein